VSSVKLNSMPADDTAKGEHIEDEQDEAEHRALSNTTGNVDCSRI